MIIYYSRLPRVRALLPESAVEICSSVTGVRQSQDYYDYNRRRRRRRFSRARCGDREIVWYYFRFHFDVPMICTSGRFVIFPRLIWVSNVYARNRFCITIRFRRRLSNRLPRRERVRWQFLLVYVKVLCRDHLEFFLHFFFLTTHLGICVIYLLEILISSHVRTIGTGL